MQKYLFTLKRYESYLSSKRTSRFICMIKYDEQVRNLMLNETKISFFLRHLQSLISNFIDAAYIEENTYEVLDNNAQDILQELKEVLEIPSKVQLLSDTYLNIIKLSLNNVCIKLQRTKCTASPWDVIYSDLPEIPSFGPFKKNLSTLMIARNKFKLQVEMLEATWLNLQQIDKHCWVLDPLQPKPCHLYRRIFLTQALSMFIKIDPLYSRDLPEIKFMGSETEVELQRDLMSKNVHNWNPNYNIVENLMMLLNIDIFPKEVKQEYIKDENAIVTDKECCICYSMVLDNEILPDKICNNEKCRRHFHTPCLLQWLQAVPGNHSVFGHIHGTCPHCEENISCYIK
ncbi:E3 ubiquitin-protein ligase Fancl isoform X2 [Nomia melanderi]|uniref:E3 ubiquitin-protein ligase Fancl isoform X2 n=1 Tax=Nomia melanderi TaxID=2448451 RepID=UPI001304616D|nr:E3 ubiquitin-protein ligase FANCL isoform X2 [Nomia melanderi]